MPTKLRPTFGQRFWNPITGRFGTVDLDGELHDYGFTFLNNEAIYFDFATPEQAKSIHAWMSGRAPSRAIPRSAPTSTTGALRLAYDPP